MTTKTAAKPKPDMLPKWRVKNGARIAKDKVDVYGEELYLLNKKGKGGAADIVEAATNKKSPLHEFIFDKSDGEAAEQYRLSRARYLQQSIEIKIYRDPDYELDPAYVRAFHPVKVTYEKDDDESLSKKYVNLDMIQGDEALQLQMHQRALGDLEAFQKRYNDILVSCRSKDLIKSVVDRIRRSLAS